MPTAQTLAVLADLKKAGLDTTSLEQQMKVDPIKEKSADNIIGGGILRLADYTRFAGDYKRKEEDLEKRVVELATRHDSLAHLTEGSDAYKEMADHIAILEKALMDTDEFSEESIKNISFVGKQKLEALIKQPTANNDNPPNPNPEKKEGNNDMPANFDPNKTYVDADDLRTSQANLAFGTLTTGLKLQAALEEIKALGISVTREKVDELEKHMHENFSKGSGSLDEVLDKTFDLTNIRATKATEARQRELDEARVAGRSEGLKEAGVPERKLTRLGSHVILDSKVIGNRNSVEKPTDSLRDDNGKIDPTKLPRNAAGEIEHYKLRGDRASRLNRAANLFNEVSEKLEQDITYVE